MAINITNNNCISSIEAQLCSLPCGWKSQIASAICTAVNGAIGRSGYSGFSGRDGDGESGISGYSGYSGYSGISGFSGANPGQSGYSGYSGSNPGLSGFSGFSGDNPGSSGFSGYSGYSGYSGFSGRSGTSGFSGFSGPQGIQGFSGFSGAVGTITANNALRMSTPTNVQFGGLTPPGEPLLHNSYVDMAGFITNFNGAVNADGAFQVVNTDTTNNITAIYGEATSGSVFGTGVKGVGKSVGVYGVGTIGAGVQGTATTGVGGTFSSTNAGLAIVAQLTAATTNTIISQSQFSRFTSGTAASGIGMGLDMFVQDTGGSAFLSNRIVSKWVDATHATRTSQMDIVGLNSGVENTIMSAYGSGVVGIGKSSGYTATRLEVVDNSLPTSSNMAVFSSSSSAAGSTLIRVTATGSTAGIVTNSVDQVAITGIATTAAGVNAQSTSGLGIQASSITGVGGSFSVSPSSTNTIVEAAQFSRGTSGSAAAGIGVSIGLYAEDDSNSSHLVGSFTGSWTDVAVASRNSKIGFNVVSGGSTVSVLTIDNLAIFTLVQGLQNFADDTAAAGGGIPVNGLYRNGSVVQIRVT